jgi:hypothetical protein
MPPVAALVAEFARRGIAARPAPSSPDHAARAAINNVEVDIHFDGTGVTWPGNDGRVHRMGAVTAPAVLADAIIDSLLNPA